MEVLKDNPHVHRLIRHKEETPIDKLSDTIKELQRKFKCERVIDFSESIEVALSQHPRSPNYKLPKPERLARFNRNFYEYTFEHAGEDWQGVNLRPELFFTNDELSDAMQYVAHDRFNILIGMSGSGTNKAWPWTEELAMRICEEYPDVHIITVGDERCRLIEPELPGRITNLSGKIPMRTSMALTGLVHLVIAPDTGIIHAAGCYPTPKLCLLGHNTREAITKHFENDYSIEADEVLAPCAPCLYLIYDMKIQCPTDVTGGAMCMSRGIPLETVFNRFKEIHAKHSH
jgi:ADP-heptose:LPS heptosyltransferase